MKLKIMNINLKDLSDIEIEGIDTKDYPDFCDAFVAGGLRKLKNGKYRKLTEKECNYLSDEERDFVYEKVIKHLY